LEMDMDIALAKNICSNCTCISTLISHFFSLII
jgi:hypothetical protein